MTTVEKTVPDGELTEPGGPALLDPAAADPVVGVGTPGSERPALVVQWAQRHGVEVTQRLADAEDFADEVQRRLTPANPTDTYAKAWRVWTRFCADQEFPELEATRCALVAFVVWLLDQGRADGNGYAPSSGGTILAGAVVELRPPGRGGEPGRPGTGPGHAGGRRRGEGPVRCREDAAGVRAGGRPSARTRRTRPAPDAQIHGRPVDGVHHDQVVNEKPERSPPSTVRDGAVVTTDRCLAAHCRLPGIVPGVHVIALLGVHKLRQWSTSAGAAAVAEHHSQTSFGSRSPGRRSTFGRINVPCRTGSSSLAWFSQGPRWVSRGCMRSQAVAVAVP
ncbi:hypothetical protein SUDANB70_06084 (plasmid) [Streptomyces sp. enrichment culture]